MSQSDNRAVTEQTAVPAPAPVTAAPLPARSPADIERDIEVTRARLATAIDDLADRVNPKNVARRGVDKARLTVVDETGNLRTTRIAAIGAAIAAFAAIVMWRRRG